MWITYFLSVLVDGLVHNTISALSQDFDDLESAVALLSVDALLGVLPEILFDIKQWRIGLRLHVVACLVLRFTHFLMVLGHVGAPSHCLSM